jgi:type IV pilus assembly protein PilA
MNSSKCSECGFVGWSDAEYCKKCGAPAALGSVDSDYQRPGSYGNNQSWDRGASYGEVKKGLAICALVVGIVSFLTLGLLGVGAVLGIILALVAMARTNRNPAKYGGKGMAIAGLVLSISSLVIVVPVGIIAAIAVPNLLAARRTANEGSTLHSLRTISSAEATYYSRYQKYGTLDQLGSQGLIDPNLASGTKNGYKFKLEIVMREDPDPVGFEAVGVPITYPNSGRRSFYIDETGVIRAADNRGVEATRFDSPLDSNRDYRSDWPRSGRYDPDAED